MHIDFVLDHNSLSIQTPRTLRDALLRFAKAMAPAMHQTVLRLSMLAALDRHHKQNGSKISMAKDLESAKCRQVKGRRKKQKLFARKATKHGQMTKKHSPSKMKSSYGNRVQVAKKVKCHSSWLVCNICSPFILLFWSCQEHHEMFIKGFVVTWKRIKAQST